MSNLTIGDVWTTFETWVHSWLPGLKTRITTALGAIGMAAVPAYTYITGLPATKYISQETLALTSAGLFTLSYWFSNMGKRVEADEATPTVAPVVVEPVTVSEVTVTP